MRHRVKYIAAAMLSRLNNAVRSSSFGDDKLGAKSKDDWLRYFDRHLRNVSIKDSFDDIFHQFCADGLFKVHKDDFAPNYYSADHTQITGYYDNSQFSQLAAKLDHLGHQWLLDALRKIDGIEKEESPGLASSYKIASASNRSVSFKDNQQTITDIDDRVKELLTELAKNNEFNSLPIEEKDAVVADIKVGNELTKQDHFWLKSLWQTLVQGLRYLAKKFSDSLIGKLASALLEVLAEKLG